MTEQHRSIFNSWFEDTNTRSWYGCLAVPLHVSDSTRYNYKNLSNEISHHNAYGNVVYRAHKLKFNPCLYTVSVWYVLIDILVMANILYYQYKSDFN